MAFIAKNFYLASSPDAVPRTWHLSGTDAVSDVRASGYIPNNLGVGNGDKVEYVKTDASPIARQLMLANVNPTTKVVDLSDGTAITATNT